MRRALGIFCLVLGVVLLIYQVNDHALPPAAPDAPPAAPDPDAEAVRRPGSDARGSDDGVRDAATSRSDDARGVLTLPRANVTGILGGVTAARTGEGIGGAEVRLRGTRFSTVTDASGQFRLEVVGRWAGIVRVEAPGYSPATLPVDMRGGLPVPPLAFRLRPGAIVSGRVLDPRGGPVAGARVYGRGHPEGVVMTDTHGNFRLGGFRIDRPLVVTAEAEGFLSTCTAGLHIQPGEERKGLILTFATPARISGVVLAFDGSPAVGVEVGTGSRSNRSGWWTRTDQRGRFELTPLRGGDHLIQAMARDGSPATARVRGLPDGGVREGVELRLGSVIRGRVVTAAGAPVPRATVMVEPVSRVAGGSSGRTCKTGPDGWFRIALPFGTDYHLQAVWPDTVARTPRQQVTLGDMNAVIRLREPVTISGEVLLPDGQPAPMFVIVIRRSAPRHFLAQRITGRAGRFRLTDLPPGRCRLSAEAVGGWSEPVELDLSPGEEGKGLRFELQKVGVVHVQVKDAQGKPLDGALVLLHPVDEEWEVLSASTTGKRPAVFSQVRPGRYTATVRHAFKMDLATHEEFEVTATETKELTITIGS